MNNFVYMVPNADILVKYTEFIIHILVKCVIRHSVNRAVLQGIYAYIVVIALIPVKCVIKHSFNRVV
jgi:hypothetical protein